MCGHTATPVREIYLTVHNLPEPSPAALFRSRKRKSSQVWPRFMNRWVQIPIQKKRILKGMTYTNQERIFDFAVSGRSFKKILVISLVVIINSCSSESSNGSGDNADSIKSPVKGTAQYDAEFVQSDKTVLDTLNYGRCFVSPVEIVDLYDSLSSIPHDKDEKIFIVQILNKQGFVSETWAREKWLQGPRIISVMVYKGSCKCFIDKLYYDTNTRNKYKVTERLKCFEKKD
jgi:hypothetical protein